MVRASHHFKLTKSLDYDQTQSADVCSVGPSTSSGCLHSYKYQWNCVVVILSTCAEKMWTWCYGFWSPTQQLIWQRFHNLAVEF